MAWENVATLGIAVAALVVSIASARYSKKSANASDRSAKAAERSAVAAERQAAAAEAALPPPEPPVRWAVRPQGRDGYVMRNMGSDPAFNVKLDDRGGFITVLDQHEVVQPGESVEFWIVRVAEAVGINEVHVTWDGQDEPVVVPLH
ncbi:hypothetical protein [Micromonospora sp. M71_S20]|uniref:hypothetical protein n=1 Tax=Micromonospora sp. M71_S20 TaxID=592872 RepID=UPI0011E60334|nr:hypothetical protein [Micromonospora sp. M71_S20]